MENKNNIENKDLLIRKIEDGEVYELWTAYHPELKLPSYAIYNRLHDVIEHFQPNYVNAMNVRDEFIGWIKQRAKGNGPEELKDLADLT